MKELKFKTSKGEFLVIDKEDVEVAFSLVIKNIRERFNLKQVVGYALKDITEKQASEITDEIHGNVSFITTLNILLKSKGIHLFENPIDLDERLECNCDICYGRLESDHEESEQKTFYNPYIFKIK